MKLPAMATIFSLLVKYAGIMGEQNAEYHSKVFVGASATKNVTLRAP
jgi:hypothetical protein